MNGCLFGPVAIIRRSQSIIKNAETIGDALITAHKLRVSRAKNPLFNDGGIFTPFRRITKSIFPMELCGQKSLKLKNFAFNRRAA